MRTCRCSLLRRIHDPHRAKVVTMVCVAQDILLRLDRVLHLTCLCDQHRSDELRPGADPRWALICCYNTKHNRVDDNPGHPSCTPAHPRLTCCDHSCKSFMVPVMAFVELVSLQTVDSKFGETSVCWSLAEHSGAPCRQGFGTTASRSKRRTIWSDSSPVQH